VFNMAHLAALTGLMVDVIEGEVDRLMEQSAAPVDVERAMNAMTQRLILETMLGRGIDRRETDRLGNEIAVALKGMDRRVFLCFLSERLPAPGERRYRAAIAAVDEAMLRLVRTRRAEGAHREDLLSLLLRARDEDTGEGMDDQQLRDELVTMFA